LRTLHLFFVWCSVAEGALSSISCVDFPLMLVGCFPSTGGTENGIQQAIIGWKSEI
jgi:hypothetical protein